MVHKNNYPSTKDIIYLLGVETLLAGSIFLPGLGIIAQAVYKAKQKSDWKKSQKEWQKFNVYLLKRNLKRLKEQKVVEIIEENGNEVIKLTEKGHIQYLKYKLEEISLKGKPWDGKWRVIIYDVGKLKKNAQENFRRILRQINFYRLQKSVYLTPYQCMKEIQYLREYFSIGDEVLVLEISKIENEEIYKKYFGL